MLHCNKLEPHRGEETAMSTTTTKATKAEEQSNALVSWARLGLETLSDVQKQWINIATGYGDLAFQAAKDNLATLEGFYGQTRKSAEQIVKGQRERIEATIERIS